MKAAVFDYQRPSTVHEALSMLGGTAGARVLAGGQTLGPMLNLRLAQPALLVDITRIGELAVVEQDSQSVTLGAIVTHAAIEDGCVGDATGRFLAQVARGIAYRAVRTRGTVGGSLAHADPAADWLSCLVALGASVLIASPRGDRAVALAQFVRGAMEADLAPDEMIRAVRMPRLTARARFGFHKICRKTGEFADAIGVVVHDPERDWLRLSVSTPHGTPIVIERKDCPEPWQSLATDGTALHGLLNRSGLTADTYEMNIHVAAVQRALRQVLAA
jgi:carbon-monoxide dehydrogenase medium subunit